MKQHQNQTFDQKKGSADQCVTGNRQGMPGGNIGRDEASRSNMKSRSDHGGEEGNSRERKTARNGSDSNGS